MCYVVIAVKISMRYCYFGSVCNKIAFTARHSNRRLSETNRESMARSPGFIRASLLEIFYSLP
jgi:hypothetical protein